MREVLNARLTQWGYDARTADSGCTGRLLAEGFDPQIILSDLVLPDVTGLELLYRLRAAKPTRTIILMTAYGNVDTAVRAMKLGASNFLTKPIDHDALKDQLRHASEAYNGNAKLPAERSSSGRGLRGSGLGGLVGDSEAQRSLYQLIKENVTAKSPALISGERGSGKELVARTIHSIGPRKNAPFIAMNTATSPEGLTDAAVFGHTAKESRGIGIFERANGGTLFLDDLTDIPVSLQAQLVRVLKEGRIRRIGSNEEVVLDVCVLGATSADPAVAVEEGKISKELYDYLNVCAIRVPPLRERKSDIPLLVEHFIRHFNEKYRTRISYIYPDAMVLLKSYDWPGNVRQLHNAIERAVVLSASDTILPQHLPGYLTQEFSESEAPKHITLPLGVTRAEADRIFIAETLRHVGNNKSEAARRLGLDVKTVRKQLKALDKPPK